MNRGRRERMPWKIVKSGNKWKVVSKTSGKTKGTHETREEALKQLRALYYLQSKGKIR
jgi:hypothetical protein